MPHRDARVLGRHLEGLEELQVLRRAMDDETKDFRVWFATVFQAAVDYSRVAQTLHALLLTDVELGRAHRPMSAATGLGPQLPMLELAEWLDARRRAGDVAHDLDTVAAALTLCGTADYIATLHTAVEAPAAHAAYGGMPRAVGHLLASLGVRGASPALLTD